LPVSPQIAGRDAGFATWRPAPAAAAAGGILLALCVLNLHRISPFLYFRF
jgi:hypothetical protein